MIKQVIEILKNYGYKVGYSAYHTDLQIKKYASKKDKVSKEKFFTIYSPDGYVVGRVHSFKENEEFQVSHLHTIIGYFKMFEIPHHKSIVEELEKISLEVKNK